MAYFQPVVRKRAETLASVRAEVGEYGRNLVQNLYKIRTPLRTLGPSNELAGCECMTALETRSTGRMAFDWRLTIGCPTLDSETSKTSSLAV